MKKKIGKINPRSYEFDPENPGANNPVIDDNTGINTNPVIDDSTGIDEDTVIDNNTRELKDSKLIGKQVWIQCTWVKAYSQPDVKTACIRSYDRTTVSRMCQKNFNGSSKAAWYDPAYKIYLGLQFPIKLNQIGELTGNYITTGKVRWMESRLLYCDRALIGWFRESDIWYNLKNVKPNPLDWKYIPYVEPGTPGENPPPGPGENSETKNKSWIAWLTAGITALSLLR